MKNFSLLIKLLAAVAVFSLPVSLYAASATWLGTTDGVWATGTNWSATPVPGTGNTATFDNAGNGNVILDLGAGVTISTLLFDTASAAAYTIGSGAVGSQTLTLNNGGAITLSNTVANDQLINAALVLGTTTANTSFTLTNNSAANSLTLAGNVSRSFTGTKTLNVAGEGDTVISGSFSNVNGGINVVKSGGGALTMSGAGSAMGSLTLNGGTSTFEGSNGTMGTVNVNNATAIFTGTYTGAGATSVLNGGTLELDFSAAGAPAIDILNNSANNSALTLAGGTLNVTLSSTATANTQRFNGTTFSGAASLRVDQNANSNSGSGLTLGGLTRSNNGTVDFTLPTTGTITTTTTSSVGTNLVLTGASAAYATNNATDWITVSGGGLLGTTAGLYVDDTFTASADVNITNSLAPSAFTVNTLRFNTAGSTLTLDTSANSVVTSGGILVTSAGTGTVIASGGVGAALTSGLSADQIVIHNYGGLTISAPIVDNSGAVSFVNTGSGTTLLSALNAYTGATVINNGTVTLGGTGSIATTSSATINGGTFFMTGANDLSVQTVTVNGANGLTFNDGVGTYVLGSLAGSSLGSIALNDDLAGAVNLQVGGNNAVSSSYLGALSGAGDFIKVGTGTQILGGLNGSSFSGDVYILEGILTANGGTSNTSQLGTGTIFLGADGGAAAAQLTYGNAGAAPTLANTIQVEDGAGARVLFYNSTSGSATHSGGIVLDNDLEIRRTGGGGFSINGGITGTGDVRITTTGAGTGGNMVIGGANPVDMVGRLINQSEVGNSGVAVSASIGANVTDIIQNGASSMLLSGTNSSFVGDVDVQSGNLRVSNANGLNANNVVTIGATGTFTVANGTTTLTVAGLEGSGTVTKEGGNIRTLTLGGSGTYSSSATLTEILGGSFHLVKSGSGIQTLSGTGNYTGTTLVSNGTLLINGTIAGSSVTVSGTGNLGGIGTISAASSINSGGTLSPGNSPGTLTFDSDLTLAGGVGILGGAAVFEGGDLVDVNGILTLNDDWNLTLQTGFQNNGSVTLFTYTTAGATMDLTPDFDISGLGFTPSGALTLTDTGNSIVLNGISVIPEPSTFLLLAAGLGFFVVRRLRRVL